MHYCDCKGTTKLQLLQRVFQRMLTSEEDEYGNEEHILAPCKVYNTYAGRCGLLSPAGRPLTPPLYTSISAISNNLYFCTFDYSDQGLFVDGSGNVVNDDLL